MNIPPEKKRVILGYLEYALEGLKNVPSKDLAFALAQIVKNAVPNSPSYADYVELIGVLESVKLEFYRTVVTDFQETQRQINGDAF